MFNWFIDAKIVKNARIYNSNNMFFAFGEELL